jgi:hypothetical protein
MSEIKLHMTNVSHSTSTGTSDTQQNNCKTFIKPNVNANISFNFLKRGVNSILNLLKLKIPSLHSSKILQDKHGGQV